MEADVNKQELNINKLVSTKNKTVFIEGDIIVPDVKPDILNTIDSVGNVCIYKKDVLDGIIRFDGGVNVYVIYLADSQGDTTRGLTTTLDFTEIVDINECRQDMDITTNIKVKNIDCKVLYGRKISIRAEVDMDIQIYSNEKVELIKEVKNIESLQTLNTNMDINTLIGEGVTKAYAKDTISYDETDSLVEILKSEININNKETKTSYNKVLAKADANVKIMYLTEDGELKVINANIPVMGFIDIENISEDSIISTNYEMKNILIKPNNNDQHSIYVEIEVEISCMTYKKENIELIQDMYLTSDEDIEFSTKCIDIQTDKQTKKDICNIEEKILVPEISNNKIYDVEITPIINNINILNNRVVYEGDLNLNFIFASNTTVGIDSKRYVLPFSFEIKDDCISSNKKITTQIECVGDNFVVISNGEIECKINLQFEMELSDYKNINIIDEVKVINNRNVQNYSMVIYTVKQGDTLWSIAKRYKTTVEDIININELESDKIDIGNKIYIQRYKENKNKIIA